MANEDICVRAVPVENGKEVEGLTEALHRAAQEGYVVTSITLGTRRRLLFLKQAYALLVLQHVGPGSPLGLFLRDSVLKAVPDEALGKEVSARMHAAVKAAGGEKDD